MANFSVSSKKITEALDAEFNLTYLRIFFCAIVVICSFYQISIFYEISINLFCTLLAATASLGAAVMIFSPVVFRNAPIPVLMTLFFNISALSGPLVFKTFEGDAVTSNLLVPTTTFSVLVVAQLVILGALGVYVKFKPFRDMREFLAERILNPIGIFWWPSDAAFWFMGGIGLTATFLIGTDTESVNPGVVTKIFGGLQLFRYAPFMVIFRGLSGTVGVISNNKFIAVGIFFCFLVFAGLVQNSRGVFVDAGMMCACAAILCIARGIVPLRLLKISHLIVIVLVCFFIYTVMTKLALAMVSIRSFRGSVDYMDLVALSIEAFFDPKISNAYEVSEESAVFVGGYGENYISSRLLSRLLMIKFHDNMFYYLSFMNDDNIKYLIGNSIDRLIGIFPQPALDILNINIVKNDMRNSFGDYVIYLVDGWGLGGYKTGSMISNLYALTGIFFPGLMFFGSLILFVVYDAFRLGDNFSPVLGLIVWSVVGTLGGMGFNSESLVNVISGIFRTIPQIIFLYLVIIFCLKTFGIERKLA